MQDRKADHQELSEFAAISRVADSAFIWAKTAFGERVANDKSERNQRFLEEALELVQACDFSRESAHKVVDYVYDRPKGETHQEVAGSFIEKRRKTPSFMAGI